MTLYLLDANVLITADAQYYELERVPEFWEWLKHQGEQGHAKIPQEVYEEITIGRGALPDWLKDSDTKTALLLKETVDERLVSQVITHGYASDLTDDELEVVGRDPFLIAYGLSDAERRCVVTTEVSKPKATRQNRKVPDVCAAMTVPCIGAFEFFRRQDFRTGWRGNG